MCSKVNSSHLKCLAMLPCDLSLTTIQISDWRHFSDINVSQFSVATCLKHGGILKKNKFIANLIPSPTVKKVWKSVNIWWSYVMGKSLVSCFFWLTVYIFTFQNQVMTTILKVVYRKVWNLCVVGSKQLPECTS